MVDRTKRRRVAEAGVVSDILNDAEHWRERAEEARALADMMTDEQARRSMLKIAQGYDDLAERAAKRTISDKPLPLGRNLP